MLFWWTELRTSNKKLPSGHRTSGIQPDYRIRRLPLSDVDIDILVVEAKQHLKSATREFTNAVRDYAFACPRATVLLASYGPIVANAMDHVKSKFQDRAQFHAQVQPGQPANVSAFRTAIMEAVTAAVGLPKQRPFEGPVKVSLTWGSSPLDLDLHILQEGHAGAYVYYKQPNFAGVRLAADVKFRNGPETAEIEPSETTYVIAVHQYSDDGQLSASNAKIEIAFEGNGSDLLTFEVPKAKSGRWWHVARVDMAAGSFTAINLLNDTPLA